MEATVLLICCISIGISSMSNYVQIQLSKVARLRAHMHSYFPRCAVDISPLICSVVFVHNYSCW
uniref:Uncharacterized protein n=1 Tax=Parascaris univalens TaxID=6257 RepID=A0A914ZKN5_PARUN